MLSLIELYWKNLSQTHECDDFYPNGKYSNYPEEMAEYTFMIVLPTLAAFNLALPICGIISSAIYPMIFGNGIWPKGSKFHSMYLLTAILR